MKSLGSFSRICSDKVILYTFIQWSLIRDSGDGAPALCNLRDYMFVGIAPSALKSALPFSILPGPDTILGSNYDEEVFGIV